MKNNNNRRRKVKGRNQNHIRKILYEEIELWAPKVKINTSPFLNTSITQINKVRVVIKESDKILTSTDKILTRQVTITSSGRQENNRQIVQDENSPPPLLHSPRPPPPGACSGPIRGKNVTKLSQYEFEPYPNFPSSLKRRKIQGQCTLKFSHQTPRQRDSESNDDFNERIAQWLSTRPERPDCQLDSKQAVIRDFGYGEKILSIT